MSGLPICTKLRSSATAFRDNTVYDSDGDALRLGVQADECVEAADTIEAMYEALHRYREWAAHFDASVPQEIVAATAKALARARSEHPSEGGR